MLDGVTRFGFIGALVALSMLLYFKLKGNADRNMADTIRLEIWKLETDLDDLIDWYWGAINTPPSLEIPSKVELRNQFSKEKEQILQQKRRLEKKLHELEIRG